MIQSTFLPRTTVMVHCYSVMSWLCTAPVSPAPQSAVQQLTVLKLGEANSGSGGLTGQVEAGASVQTSQMFVAGGAGDSVRGVVGEVGATAGSWPSSPWPT